MEIFENIYSFWTLALIVLFAGNGIFFMTYVKHPAWLCNRSSIFTIGSSQKNQNKSNKKNQKKSKAFKLKANAKKQMISQQTADISSGGISSSELSSDTIDQHKTKIRKNQPIIKPLKDNTKHVKNTIKTKHVEQPKATKSTELKKDTKSAESKKDAKSTESKKDTQSTECKKDTKFSESKKDTKPIESKKDTKPIESKKDTKPIESTKDTKPIESKKDTKPIESKKDTKPIGSKKDSKPIVLKNDTKPIESKKDTKPIDLKKDLKPIESKKDSKPKEIVHNSQLIQLKDKPLSHSITKFSETLNHLNQKLPKSQTSTISQTNTKKSKKKRARKDTETREINTVFTTVDLPKNIKKIIDHEEQQAQDDIEDEWNVVSAKGKTKFPKEERSHREILEIQSVDIPVTAETKHVSKMELFDHKFGDSDLINSEMEQVPSLIDVFDKSLADMKEREQYFKKRHDAKMLEKIMNARIVSIHENGEENGFAASAAVASVHHLKQTLMGENRMLQPAFEDINQSNVNGSIYQQQLTREHQIRTNEIQHEFLKLSKSGLDDWNVTTSSTIPTTSVPMSQPNSFQSNYNQMNAFNTMSSGQFNWDKSNDHSVDPFNSSFEFISKRLNKVESEQISNSECDEGSIVMRRRDFSERSDREGCSPQMVVNDDVNKSESIDDEYCVVSNEYSRRTYVDTDVLTHGMTYEGTMSNRPDENQGFTYQEQHNSDVDDLNEYSVIDGSRSMTDSDKSNMDRDAPINSLTFHGQSPNYRDTVQEEDQNKTLEGQEDIQNSESIDNSNVNTKHMCKPWYSPVLNVYKHDTVNGNFPSYKIQKQAVLIGAMKSLKDPRAFLNSNVQQNNNRSQNVQASNSMNQFPRDMRSSA